MAVEERILTPSWLNDELIVKTLLYVLILAFETSTFELPPRNKAMGDVHGYAISLNALAESISKNGTFIKCLRLFIHDVGFCSIARFSGKGCGRPRTTGANKSQLPASFYVYT